MENNLLFRQMSEYCHRVKDPLDPTQRFSEQILYPEKFIETWSGNADANNISIILYIIAWWLKPL
jgi:hypothetical protein